MLLSSGVNTSLHNLQLVQNSAAIVLARTRRTEHINPVLALLCWLAIKFGVHFKVLLLAFKALHGLAPSYALIFSSHMCPPTPYDLLTFTLQSSEAGLFHSELQYFGTICQPIFEYPICWISRLICYFMFYCIMQTVILPCFNDSQISQILFFFLCVVTMCEFHFK